MKTFRKFKGEKGSITLTVVAAMLFITSSILIAYFSLSNLSNDQSRKIRQVADSYKVSNSSIIEKYKDNYDKFVADLDYSNGLGDINSDKQIDSLDIDCINEYINKSRDLTGLQKVLADINKDKNIDSNDVALLQEKINQNNN